MGNAVSNNIILPSFWLSQANAIWLLWPLWLNGVHHTIYVTRSASTTATEELIRLLKMKMEVVEELEQTKMTKDKIVNSN